MANSNRTEIYIEGSKEAIDNFVERFEKCHSGTYPNQEENPHIADEFGADAELFIDKVGSKWVEIYDEGIYHSSDNRCEIYLDTAWYPPSDMILEIYRQLAEIDDEIKEKRELEKIILCDVQMEIYPNLEKSLLDLIHNSGYPDIKFEKKINFEELYNKRLN